MAMMAVRVLERCGKEGRERKASAAMAMPKCAGLVQQRIAATHASGRQVQARLQALLWSRRQASCKCPNARAPLTR